MRVPALVLSCLLLVPAALATHAPARDPAAEVENGAVIVLALEAQGTIASSGEGEVRRPASLTRATHASTWTYSWGGTLELKVRSDGTLIGDAQFTGAGSGRLLDANHLTVYDHEGSVVNEIETSKTCEPLSTIANAGKLRAKGLIDKDSGEIIVLVSGLAKSARSPDCTWHGENGYTETSDLYPVPPLSPLVVEQIRLVASGDPRVRALDADLDEMNAAQSLIFSVPLASGHTILRGGGSADLPVREDAPLSHACPKSSDENIIKGTCTARGTLHVRMLVDPCPFAKASRVVHMAAVEALKQPPAGSSESQARAFHVDVRQKVNALLGDERIIQLLCSDESTEAMSAAARAAQKAADAWEDVARTHGLSDAGKNDLLSAERQRQLLGGGDASAESAQLIGAVLEAPGTYGAIRIRVHSPVALHAWDAQGRHVGWNETTSAADAQVEGSNYTGQPGGAQVLTLPSGAYKVATVELGAGRYLLDTSWNASAEEGFELLPLASATGRTMVTNVMLDQFGMFAAPAQRLASAEVAPASFVESWRPLAVTPASDTASPGAKAGGDPATGAAPTPGVSALFVLVTLTALAWITRRR